MELKISLIVSVIVIVDSLSNDTDEYSLIIVDKDCNDDQTCYGDQLVFCDLKIRKCSCGITPSASSSLNQNISLVLVNDSLKCISGKNIGTGCRLDQECLLTDPKSLCSSSVCNCQRSFRIRNDSSLCTMDTDTSSHNVKVNTHMLPIMIVMGLMFVGMCVALNMFSRARFDERSRGVFATTSNSRIVKSGSQMRRTQRRASRVPVHLEVVPSSSHSPDHSINFEPSLEPLQSSSCREEDPNRA